MTAAAPAPRRQSRRPSPGGGRHLRAVEDRGPSVGILTVVGIVLVMGVLLATVAVQTLLFEARIRSDALEDEVAQRQRTVSELEVEVAGLEAPARILSEAQSRLDMRPAAGRTYLAPVVPGDVDAPVPPPTGADPFGPGVDG